MTDPSLSADGAVMAFTSDAPDLAPAKTDRSRGVFVRGREDPTLRITRGTVVTWRWRSQSSHNVTVRSGPQHFRAPTRSRGVFARRLIRAGTYRIVCTLHSPGMGMTVVVR